MIKSMTGYGLVQIETEFYTLQAELKTLNSKFLDLSLRLPKELSAFEYQFRDILTKGLVRGKAVFSLEMTLKEGIQNSVYNNEIFQKLFKELKVVSERHDVSDSDIFNNVLKMPEVLRQSNVTLEIIDEKSALDLVKSLVEKCNEFRIQEGKSLEKALTDSITAIDDRLIEIKKIEPARTEAIRTKISESVHEIIEKDKVDENRFEQELIYYIEKLDINEEFVRLKNHLEYFVETLSLPESQGKKLGFISQELGREINTIGSKANDVAIQRLVVEMKDELEKIKEQVLNIL